LGNENTRRAVLLQLYYFGRVPLFFNRIFGDLAPFPSKIEIRDLESGAKRRPEPYISLMPTFYMLRNICERDTNKPRVEQEDPEEEK
jgi:hypothetical protein